MEDLRFNSRSDQPRGMPAKLPPDSAPGPYYYDIFGMHLSAPVLIPGFLPVSPQPGVASIEIRFGNVPGSISAVEYSDEAVQASSMECLFELPGRLRFYVNPKEQIFAEKAEGMETSAFWGFLLGVSLSVIGLRRGYVPLHASAVSADGTAVALAGQSGSGKSTTAAALIALGYQPHADDLCLTRMGAGDAPTIGQGPAELRLWDEAVGVLAWPESGRSAYVDNTSKAVYRLPPLSASDLTLRRIYALEFTDDTVRHGIHRLRGFDAMKILMGCLRVRPGLITPGLQQRLFENLARIVGEVEVFRFSRPLDSRRVQFWTSHLADHIGAMTPQPTTGKPA